METNITHAEITNVAAFYLANANAAEPTTAANSTAIAILGYLAASFNPLSNVNKVVDPGEAILKAAALHLAEAA